LRLPQQAETSTRCRASGPGIAGKAVGEILLIHELLHALGLGENPPARSHLTDAV
jgi:hypothetical protein